MKTPPGGYWVIVTTRDRPKTLAATLRSLENQSAKPKRIVLLDDGSSPPTEAASPLVDVIRRENEKYDVRRLAQNWNICLSYAVRRGIADKTRFVLFSADDCKYPEEYAAEIMRRMERDGTEVASGSRGLPAAPDGWRPPEGSGRMVANAFLHRVCFRFPERCGFESWLVYEAMRKGREIALYQDIAYKHIGPVGGQHAFREWGTVAWCLGYDPLLFAVHSARNLLRGTMPRRGVARMLNAYVKACVCPPPGAFYAPYSDELRRFVRTFQRTRLRTALRKIAFGKNED